MAHDITDMAINELQTTSLVEELAQGIDFHGKNSETRGGAGKVSGSETLDFEGSRLP